jgi:hypothetical protein
VTVDEHEWLAKRFEENRTHLRAVAHRMLGSLSEADDAVQETWLRLSRSDISGVENLGGWLTTVVARLCLDLLRSRASRREESLGTHGPEPIANREDGTIAEVGAEFLFQVVAERAEKAAVVLTTNLPFSEWSQVIPNARLCKALLDRITANQELHRRNIAHPLIPEQRPVRSSERVDNHSQICRDN